MRDALGLHRAAPFSWGKSDCTMFAHVVWAMTGWDPIEDIRGYTDERSAMRKLLDAGFRSAPELIQARFTEIPVSEAQRGDIGYPEIIGHRLMSPAVIDGQSAFSKSPDGWLVLPRSAIKVAFAV